MGEERYFSCGGRRSDCRIVKREVMEKIELQIYGIVQETPNTSLLSSLSRIIRSVIYPVSS
jgi:hypothetical protein